MIYYQGENENFGPLSYLSAYRHIFPKVIEAHRKLFNDPSLPFGIISLAGWGTKGTDPENDPYARYPYIMEVHAQTHQSTPNTGLISIHDLGHASIHPPEKRPVGERAARWALATVYDRKVEYRPDFVYEKIRVDGERIFVHFKAVEEKQEKIDELYRAWEAKTGNTPKVEQVLPVTFKGAYKSAYRGFLIAGEDRRWYEAHVKANVKERALEVWSESVSAPVAVRYGWAQFSDGNLGSTTAPVPLFRSDEWPIPEKKK